MELTPTIAHYNLSLTQVIENGKPWGVYEMSFTHEMHGGWDKVWVVVYSSKTSRAILLADQRHLPVGHSKKRGVFTIVPLCGNVLEARYTLVGYMHKSTRAIELLEEETSDV